ncbi:hypothetical protein JYU34_002708 [Plutella xylostella]|uniref:Golgin subfamily A member 1 n=1 Tax=Plutella xylostella TaxID=51655 RepID=A0ABQ7R328_PLUXY|nr:hypothetical protein JYU34_002708 [Plutella xylostella]
MFASLKSKIKEETGNDISKLTSSWRAGNLLGRISFRDDTPATTTPSSSGGVGDTSESISPQLEAYLSDRTGGQIDQPGLQQQYTGQLEAKLRERDSVWERKVEELKQTLASVQSEEAAAAQAVARAAQADAQRAASERDAAERQLRDLRARLAAAERAQPRLDALTEELEERNRAWSTERTSLTRAAGAAEARAAELQQELELMRAALPPGDPSHHMHPADKQDLPQTGCEAYDRVCRERAVLARQLVETKMALADVKTSWSGQIAALETQDKSMALQRDLDQALEEIASLKTSLDNERTLVKLLQERAEKSSRQYDEQRAEVTRLCGELADLQQECAEYQKAVDM